MREVISINGTELPLLIDLSTRLRFTAASTPFDVGFMLTVCTQSARLVARLPTPAGRYVELSSIRAPFMSIVSLFTDSLQ